MRTDEEESRGGGGSSGAPVDHHLITSSSAAPTLVGDHHTKIIAGGFAPAFLGCPSSQRCGAGEDETKGGNDFMGHSRAPLFLTSGYTSIDVLHSDNSERNVH